ncbi:hypothetical protein NIIDMKKI_56030 [Mycobacterium kansasii]|uniref:Uncharacterized protein n=1 Tax=Mycobacterium kansasii TaxID=1768 RepID=A0A7G1IHP8_MYCKA|nr:hypothetical protein NIIDMKKI_56030 [Mycobacterium kansasii]
MAARAASNALATARAWAAAPEAWPAAALNHRAYGAAAAAIAADAGPRHEPSTNPDATEENDDAAPASSPASPSQAVAAASIGCGPAPAKIRTELISGGNTEKFITLALPQPTCPDRRARDYGPEQPLHRRAQAVSGSGELL